MAEVAAANPLGGASAVGTGVGGFTSSLRIVHPDGVASRDHSEVSDSNAHLTQGKRAWSALSPAKAAIHAR